MHTNTLTRRSRMTWMPFLLALSLFLYGTQASAAAVQETKGKGGISAFFNKVSTSISNIGGNKKIMPPREKIPYHPIDKRVTDKKVFVVTGASSGIGRQIVQILAEKHGSNAVIIPIARSQKNVDKVKAELGELTEVFPIAGDVSNPSDIERIAHHIRDNFGKIDVVFNNGGGSGPTDLLGHDFSGRADSMQAHFRQLLYSARSFSDLLKKGDNKQIVTSTFVRETGTFEDGTLKTPGYLFTGQYPASQSMKSWIIKALAKEDPKTTWRAIFGGAVDTQFVKYVFGHIAAKLKEIKGLAGVTPQKVRALMGEAAELLAKAAPSQDDFRIIAEKLGLTEPLVEAAYRAVDEEAGSLAKQRVEQLKGPFRKDRQVGQDAVDVSEGFYVEKTPEGRKVDLTTMPAGTADFRPWDLSQNITDALPVYGKIGAPEGSNEPHDLTGKQVAVTFAAHMLDAELRAKDIAAELEKIGAGVTLQAVLGESGPTSLPKNLHAVIHLTGEGDPSVRLHDITDEQIDNYAFRFMTDPLALAQGALESFVPGGKDDPSKFKDQKGTVIYIGPSTGESLSKTDGSFERNMALGSGLRGPLPSYKKEMEALGAKIGFYSLQDGDLGQQVKASLNLMSDAEQPKDIQAFSLR